MKAAFHTRRSEKSLQGIAPGGCKLEHVKVICPFYHTHFRAGARDLTDPWPAVNETGLRDHVLGPSRWAGGGLGQLTR